MQRNSYANVSPSVKGPRKTDFLPAFSFYECHVSRPIAAEAGAIIEAVATMDMRSDRVTDLLLSLREIPSKLAEVFTQRQPREPFGFHSFVKLSQDSHNLSLGLCGRFWRPDLDLAVIPTPEAFIERNVQEEAKLVLRFQVLEHEADKRTLQTETFVYCPTRRTRLFFTPYWLIIRLASGWIRRRTLKAIEKSFPV